MDGWISLMDGSGLAACRSAQDAWPYGHLSTYSCCHSQAAIPALVWYAYQQLHVDKLSNSWGWNPRNDIEVISYSRKTATVAAQRWGTRVANRGVTMGDMNLISLGGYRGLYYVCNHMTMGDGGIRIQ
eukprot:366566-Chlamydomonas_euryale.AAC.10